jgi:hypothetical protein
MEPNADVSGGPCPGEEWAYRLRDDAPSERVHIVAVHQEGRRFRVDIRHMHGHPPGREESVPRSRLKVPWKDVVSYDASMDGWRRLKAESIDGHEASALWAALELVIPSEVAELSVATSDDSLTVHDHVAFETLTGQTVAAFQSQFSWLVHDGEVFLSPRAALAVAELVCRRNPAPVLDLVMAEEAVAREKSSLTVVPSINGKTPSVPFLHHPAGEASPHDVRQQEWMAKIPVVQMRNRSVERTLRRSYDGCFGPLSRE